MLMPNVHTKVRILNFAAGVCLLLFSTNAQSQDLIVKKDGEGVVAKVLRVDNDTIHYQMLSDKKGVAYYVLRQDVAQIRLSTTPQAPVNELRYVEPDYDVRALESDFSQAEMLLKGKQDATLYYKGKGTFWSTMGATILYPPAGLATGALSAAFPPKLNTHDNPNRELLQNPTYREAYQKQAHKQKAGKAFAGFGAGVAVLGLVYVAMMSAAIGG